MINLAQHDIAVVGMSCRLPDAENYNELWKNLISGKKSIKEIPANRWNTRDFYSSDILEPNKSVSRWCGMIHGIDLFDNRFFNISPREAQKMDPQQRLLMEEAWHCIEGSGLPVSDLRSRRTGVFIGVQAIDYLQVTSQMDIPIDNYNILGNYECVLANRLSYAMGLQGKSMSLDAACASSLYAVNEARYSLLNGEIDYALVGGVCLLFHPLQYLALSKGRMLSSDGQCKSFDCDADGFVPGEGVAVLLLQRLTDAQKIGSHIYGLIKGSAANHNGATDSLTAPGVDAQRDVVVQAYRNAGISPVFTTYIEMHGVGSFFSDAAEMEALIQAFRMFPDAPAKCRVGTMKGNVGHLEAASGVAGIIKVLLMMKHRRIPPTLNMNTTNPLIDFRSSPFELVTESSHWESQENGDGRLRAGVSAFGFAGSNGHVLLESYTRSEPNRIIGQHKKKSSNHIDSNQFDNDRPSFKNSGAGLITLSAKSPEALETLIDSWNSYTRKETFNNSSLLDICGTLLTGREHFPYRCGWLVDKKSQLKEKLKKNDISIQNTRNKSDLKSILILGNLNQQGKGNTSELFFPNNAFSARIKNTYQYCGQKKHHSAHHEKNNIRHAFITGYSLARTLIDLGFRPSLIAGEGAGFITALAVSGVLDPFDALSLILKESGIPSMPLRRPEIPLYDPLSGEIRYPYAINVAYFKKLMDADFIGEQDARHCIKAAERMAGRQLIFTNFLHEWDSVLKKFNIEPSDLVVDNSLMQAVNHRSRRELILSLVMIVSSLKKLRRKWGMSPSLNPTIPTIDELSSLLVDGVLTKNDFIQLLFDSNPDLESIAIRCNHRQHLLNSDAPYPILKRTRGVLENVPDLSTWIDHSAEGNPPGFGTETTHGLVVGKVSPKWLIERANIFQLETINDRSVKTALLHLWTSNVNIRWNKLYPAGSFQRIILPTYPYQRKSFWLDSMERKKQVLPTPVTSKRKNSDSSGDGTTTDQTPSGRLNRRPETMHFTIKNIERMLIDICIQLLDIPVEEFDPEVPFDEYGVDSVMMMDFLDRLESNLRLTIQPDALTEYGTIGRLAAFLHQEIISRKRINLQRTGQDEHGTDIDAEINSEKKGNHLSFKSHNNTADILPAASDKRIAVIGMACRFPQSPDLDSYWSNLRNGRFLISEIPSSRWDISRYYSPDKTETNKMYCKWGGFINDIELFDADFFGIPEEYAIIMDPQHRILLELTKHLLDQSGYAHNEVSGSRIGVYIGGNESPYVNRYWSRLSDRQMKRVSVSRIANMIAARISDYFNFKCASQTLDTACSSSLVAIHRACEHIQSGECEMAVAGGIELLLDPRTYIEFCKGGMLSDDGKMYVFDKKAKGFVPGEGAGLVLLKPFARALKDGDSISAVILGSAVNNDGHTLGLTVPDKNGQAEVIALALENSGITPDTISYLEAHGTGTLLGDPIEIKAATEVYRRFTSEKHFCAVGSVKSNMGHLIRAAGVAGFIKMALGLHNSEIPPTLHCSDVHPRFRFEESPFYAVTKTENWNPRNGVRRAAISSFGFGGTNCHMILERFEPEKNESYVLKRHPLPLTRFNPKRLWLGDPIPDTSLDGSDSIGNPKDTGPPVTEGTVLRMDSETHWFEGYAKSFSHGDAVLRDHQVFGVQTLLGAVHSGLALHAARKTFPDGNVNGLRRVTFSEALKVFPSQQFQVSVHFRIDDKKIFFENRFIQVSGMAPSVSNLAVFGEISLCKNPRTVIPIGCDDTSFADKIDLNLWKSSATVSVPGEKFYLHQKTYGRSLFTIRHLYFGKEGVLSHIVLTPEMHSEYETYPVNPAVFDAGHITLLHAASLIDSIDDQPFIPLFIHEITLFNMNDTPVRECYCLVRITKKMKEMVYADIHFYDESGLRIIKISNYCSRRVSSPQSMGIDIPNKNPEYPMAPKAGTVPIDEPTIYSEKSTRHYDLNSEVENYIIKKLHSTMERAPENFSRDKNFLELGLDSNGLIKLSPIIEKDLGIEVYPTLFFEHQNIRELASFFLKEHKEAFQRYLKTETGDDNSSPEISGSMKHSDSSANANSDLAPVIGYTSSGHVSPPSHDMAVIGMAGRFAGADTLDEFWSHIKNGKDLVTGIPSDRWDSKTWFDADPQRPNKTYSRWGSFINNVDGFDAAFFGIGPQQATWMDPQQRILLEMIYTCSEDAGLAGKINGTNTGLYLGVCFHDYGNEIVRRGIPIVDYQYNSTIYSITAGFISYWFDLQGPCIPIDNACASSLTALHLACSAIQSGECEMAFVAGANLLLSPLHYVHFSRVQALSPTGRCRAFDRSADGYVPGEGIAAILLKPLDKAIADNDNIHALIKGTAINHVGRSNNPTAPRPELQTKLLLEAWRRAGINPETISYLETHGTGTKLGDPVEINAIRKAFETHTDKKNFCTLGSVKTNIGHLEGAAGIASIIKVILSIRHGWIPAMPTFKELNPYIQLDGTSLRINTRAEQWVRTGATPRRAGVSSFGMTGNNAHIIVEEYIQKKRKNPQPADSERNPVIIILSARNKKQLITRTRHLLIAIKKRRFADDDLRNIAYTLQTGREAMETRLAAIAKSIQEVEQKLSAFAEGMKAVTGLVYGQTAHNQQEAEATAPGQKSAHTINTWIQYRDFEKLMDFWVTGGTVDWEKLYDDTLKPRRISLPTYPFAAQRYWIPRDDEVSPVVPDSPPTSFTGVHTLLHRNSYDNDNHRFSTMFSGQEFFLSNHIVKGRKVLPGVVHLEMARAAVFHALRVTEDNPAWIRFDRIVWARPIAVDEIPLEIHITLSPADNDRIDYEIHGKSEEGDGRQIVYSQGRACLQSKSETPRIELQSLQAACRKDKIAPDLFYTEVKKSGLDLGPGFRGIEMLHIGSELVLAKLALPSSLKGTLEQFFLHPSLMDSMVQTSIALMMASGVLMGEAERKLVLPFVMQEMEIFRACTSEMWAVAGFSVGSKASDRVPKFDLALCDDHGTLCARMKGLSVRFLEPENSPPLSTGELILHPVWKQRQAARRTREATIDENKQHIVILCNVEESLKEKINASLRRVQCFRFQSHETLPDERFGDYAIYVLERIQSIMRGKPQKQVLIQIVIPPWEKLLSGLSGMLITATKENPRLFGQIIEVESTQSGDVLVEMLKENSQCDDRRIRYQSGKRWVLDWDEATISEHDIRIPWKDHGIYLITGGAGGLGRIFAREIARKAPNANLVLIGRSPFEHKEEVIKKLKPRQNRIRYIQADIGRKQVTENLVNSIREEFGDIDGIIHSAGVIRDSLLLNKTAEDLKQVLAPKVSAVVHLDEATKDMPLDFFVLFSSIAGVVGNPGQADYAAANSFMDAFSGYRNEMVSQNQRYGQTLSINWPLWEAGGMVVDDDTKELLKQNFGLSPMKTKTGINALYQGFGAQWPQWMVLAGNPEKIRKKLLPSFIINEASPDADMDLPTVNFDTLALKEKIQASLIITVSKLQHLQQENIDPNRELNAFGFDSIMLNKFANSLNSELHLDLTPTIFFEYPTIRGLAEYLAKEYGNLLAGHFHVISGSDAPASHMTPDRIPVLSEKKKQSMQTATYSTFQSISGQHRPEPIAIVGMSGRFPLADDLEGFWKNLEQGRDCIREIPRNRWDWREIYGDPATEINRSNVKWCGIIDGIEEFDPLFFGISPREAELMDPQQRLLMMYAWSAIEDAGYSAFSLSGSHTAIFVGTTSSGYCEMLSRGNLDIKGYYSTGMLPSVGPNRMSYFLNLHGPSEPVETACSSSLIAIHRAAECITNGTCEMAIAGGVNTMVSREVHISLSKAGMLCEDGRCKTFSERANGYVRGEGVGMLFLKKLKDAEKNGDHIYGVIRASAENHGGRANSLTAPNPVAQTELLKKVYQKAGIDPRTVGYIETHGTGTRLGDPVEVNALKAAFRDLYRATGEVRTPFYTCGLGSVKTNIGHLEIAAGVAGVIKVLLQLKHKTLVKSLHIDPVNPLIQLEDSPFYLIRETGPWSAPRDSQGEILPRRAGVSSFGFGGANAHVVIEEYISRRVQPPEISISNQNPAVILLSAVNEDRIKKQAGRLVSTIRSRQFAEKHLADLAYTLQIGREPLKERLAVLVDSIKELEEKLHGFIDGRNDIDRLYRGQVKPNDETLAFFAVDEDMGKTIDAWIYKKKYEKLLRLWVRGLHIDWDKLYGDAKPSRISLPTYPFAKERYWLPKTVSDSKSAGEDTARRYHPLIHRNTSDLWEQRFSSIFTGEEFFLADHVVAGRCVLPAVAYLEMARSAVEQATGSSDNGGTGICIKNVVWVKPFTMGTTPQKIHIGLYPESEEKISFEIYSHSQKDPAEAIVHCRGSAALKPEADIPTMDLPALQDHCRAGMVSSGRLYETFDDMGIKYGRGHRGVESVYLGPDLALAKLTLPSSVSHTATHFFLHPSVLDSALQASMGLVLAGNQNIGRKPSLSVGPSLPFALRELEIFGDCRPEMWAVCRYSHGSSARDIMRKFDIDLCDDTGRVRVRMREFSTREFKNGSDPDEILMFHPFWKEQVAEPMSAETQYDQHLVILCESATAYRNLIESRMKGVRCICLTSASKRIDQRYGVYSGRVFEQIQTMFTNPQKRRSLLQVVISTEDEQLLFSGLSGLLKTAGQENPRFIGQLIECDPHEDPEAITEILMQNSCCPGDRWIRHQHAKRFVTDWSEIHASTKAEDIPWKDGHVYLITGGIGGLGLIFAEDIVRNTKNATLILSGRSPLSEENSARFQELGKKGARVEYIQTDVSIESNVFDLILRIKNGFGNLHGIIHCAGVIRDNLIINKELREFQETLAPKTSGLVNLDLASKDLDLDFFVFFSSIAGAMGNAGQSDYSCANAFMDAYAGYRNRLVDSGQRRGKTVSINWPLWKDGGMHVDPATEKMIRQRTGMTAMQTFSGIRAFHQILTEDKEQVLVMEGRPAQVRRNMLTPSAAVENRYPIAEANASDENRNETNGLVEKVKSMLTGDMSSLLKVDPEEIEDDVVLNEYGFDSIMVTEFANRLNEKYQLKLTPTLFFEQPTTLDSFARYLIQEYPAAFTRQFIGQSAVQVDVAAKEDRPGEKTNRKLPPYRFFGKISPSQEIKPQDNAEAIAIVGLSGKFPMADNVNQFWKNLAQGKDCIGKIPENRWNWKDFHGDPKKQRNKTDTKWGGFMRDIDRFDAAFFKLSPREAMLMEPQQRLFLETVWHCIEDAGYRASAFSGAKIGIFVGAASMDYFEIESRLDTDIQAHTITGVSLSVLANRISYMLNLCGPSEPVDTACSSSLVAIHRAVESLRSGESTMAIAGGVNVMLTPTLFISFSKAGMLSRDGRCRTFDVNANGYVRGEGVGAVLLKPLSNAIADRDHIYAVIKGSAVNHSGRGSSLTAPNPQAQAQLLVDVYQKSGIDPSTMTYIEAHGTGTELGDPIEVTGLKRAFSDLYRKWELTEPEHPHCGLGSVKTNIGHLETAAGIAGVIKVLKAMEQETIPASLHCKEINPYIDLNHTPFYIATETSTWKRLRDRQGKLLPFRAGVNSFGFGGVNAHVILEEYIQEPKSIAPTPKSPPKHDIVGGTATGGDDYRHNLSPMILVLSAHSDERLRVYAGDLVEYLRSNFKARKQDTTISGMVESKDPLHVPQTIPPGPQREEDAIPVQMAGDIKATGAVCNILRQTVSEIMDIEADEIDTDSELADFGFDPVLLKILSEKIETCFHLPSLSFDIGVDGTIQWMARRLVEKYGTGIVSDFDSSEYFNEITTDDSTIPSANMNVGTAVPERTYAEYVAEDFTRENNAPAGNIRLMDIIYTLQVGREPLPVRFAAVIDNPEEMISALEALHRGEPGGEHVHRGTVKKSKSKQKRKKSTVANKLLLTCREYEDMDRIAALWVNGDVVDWEIFHQGTSPKRIPLPTYPFSRDRFWLPLKSDQLSTGWEAYNGNHNPPTNVNLHPLLGENHSTLKQQHFITTFTGKEFFLRDHRVQGKSILPGVAYAEMARAAAELSDAGPFHSIRNLIWMNPMVVEGETQAKIHLEPQKDGLTYKIFTDLGRQYRICGQGTIVNGNANNMEAARDELYTELKKGEWMPESNEKLIFERNGALFLDLPRVEERCPHPINSETCYGTFASFGLDYGKTFRSVTQLYCGDHEAFSRISVHQSVKNDQDGWNRFVMHPSMMDASLHTVMGLMGHGDISLGNNPYVPYFLGQLTFMDSLTENCCVYAKLYDDHSEHYKNSSQEIHSHIMITDEAGRILVLMRKMVLREVTSSVGLEKTDHDARPHTTVRAELGRQRQNIPVHLYRFEWKLSEMPSTALGNDHNCEFPIMVFDTDETLCNSMAKTFPGNNHAEKKFVIVTPGQRYEKTTGGNYCINPGKPSHYDRLLEDLGKRNETPATILHLWTLENHPAKGESQQFVLERSIYSLFFLTRSMLRANRKNKTKKQCRLSYWFASDLEQQFPAYSAVNGFALTVSREYPRFRFHTVGVDTDTLDEGKQRLAEMIAMELGTDDAVEILYRDTKRYVRGLCSINSDPKSPNPDEPNGSLPKWKKGDLPLRDDGVYMITGGLGKLGMIMAEAFSNQARVRLALVGRSSPDKEDQNRIRRLKTFGAQVKIINGDISNKKEAEAIVSEIRSSLGPINGIVHAAGVIRDSAIVGKTRREMESVFAPKIFGSKHLDEATKDEKLDFFVLFSSVSAVAGNPGQSDYAYANRYMDSFAEKRQLLVDQGLRHGKTISINWPFWHEGGMRIDRETETMQREVMGAVPLETEPGVHAFASILAARETRVLVLSGDRLKLERALGLPLAIREAEQESQSHESPQKTDGNEDIHVRLVAELQGKAAKILQVEGTSLDPEEYMQDYGFESVTLAEFAAAINETYELTLTPAIFFNLEEPTLDCLANYLETEHNDAVKVHYTGGKAASENQVAPEPSQVRETKSTKSDEYTDLSPDKKILHDNAANPSADQVDTSRKITSRQCIVKPNHPFINEIYAVDDHSGGTCYEAISHWSHIHPVFGHHMVLGKARMPGVGYVEMVYAATRFSTDQAFNCLESLYFQHPIIVDPIKTNMSKIILTPKNDSLSVKISTSEAITKDNVRSKNEKINATAVIRRVAAERKRIDVDYLRGKYSRKVEYSYRFLLRDELGFRIGPYYNSIRSVHISADENDCSALVNIRLSSKASEHNDSFFLPPGLLDPCAYAAIALINDRNLRTSVQKLYLPLCFGKVHIYGPVEKQCLCLIETRQGEENDSIVSVTITCFKPGGELLVEMSDVQFKRIDAVK